MDHIPYECKPKSNCSDGGHCQFCDGGLFICITCGGAEGSLTTDCHGKRLTDRWLTCFVYKGRYDYKDGEWQRAVGSPYPNSRLWWAPEKYRKVTKLYH